MAVKNKPAEEPKQEVPNNFEAEVAVLGAVLLDNSALARAAEVLTADDFFLPKHTFIFHQMQVMHTRQQPIDIVTLAEELRKAGELEAAGGAPYIASLADGMPRVSNVEHYGRIVKEKSLLRSLLSAAHRMTLRAFAAEDAAADIIGEMKASLATIADREPARGLVAIRNLVHEKYAKLETQLTEGRRVTGIPTGYPKLDHMTCGLQPGELIVLAARPSVGKSSLAVNIARNVLVENVPVALFSLEMSAESLLMRLVSEMTRCSFREGVANHETYKTLTQGLLQLCHLPFWIDDSAGSTLAQLTARAERAVKEFGVRLVIIDYLQLVSGGRRYGNRQEEVSDISRTFKVLAKNLNVPVMALSQLTRRPAKEGNRPQLSDLRESGAIEQDADVVIFLHRPRLNEEGVTMEERNETELLIEKQRNGPTGMIPMVFRNAYTRFEEKHIEHDPFATS